MTDWLAPAEDIFLGAGMRMFSTDSRDFSIAEIRRVVFEPAAATDAPLTDS